MKPPNAPSGPSLPLVLGAFAVIYFVWGSTFLAVRFAVEAIPPFMTGAARNLVAGLVLVAAGVVTGAARPTAAALWQALVVGVLLFVANHGAIGWASKYNPSGITALLVATIPMWIAALDWLLGSGKRPSSRAGAGMVLGFLGTLLLVWPATGAPSIDPLSAGVTSIAAIGWAAGTLRARRLPVSDSTAVSTGLPMLLGGTVLLLVSWVTGEFTGFDATRVPARAVLSLLYLIVMGSLLGFSAYVFLLRTIPAARVVTYAYVNPIVALLLGTWLGGEIVAVSTLVAAAISLCGVYLTVSD